MNKYLKICLFGFLLWLIPFVVSILIFPLRVSQRPLFESIMPVVIVIWTVFFSIMYLSGLKSDFQKAGAIIGLAWLFISIFLDLTLLFGRSHENVPFGLCDGYRGDLSDDSLYYIRFWLFVGA